MIDRSKKIAGRFYAAASGRRPVREWLLDLSKNDRRVIGKDIQKIEVGWPIGMPYCRSLGPGLWEVRSEMVLLHGFEKKTQKTPTHDIELALGRKREIDE